MEFKVRNENICVKRINIVTLGAASILKVGDSQSIQLSSIFDTPPRSVLPGPLVPIASPIAVTVIQ